MDTSYSMFQEAWWLDTVCPGEWREAVFMENGRIAARMPYVYKKRYGIPYLTSPRFTPHLGPWLVSNNGAQSRRLSWEKDVLFNLIDQLPPVYSASISCNHKLINLAPFYWRGWKIETAYTYRFEDLSNLDAIWEGVAKNIRSDIRKAEKILVTDYSCKVDSLYEMFSATYQRQGKAPPVSKSFFERIDAELRKRKQSQLFCAKDSAGNLHAAVYLVWDESCAYYLIGGADPEFRNSGAHSFLLWESIKFASRVTKSFDFEGSMVESIERFFRAFGAQQVRYHILTKRHPLLKVFQGLKSLVVKH